MKWEIYAHPISDIRDWKNNGRLELRPDFQRNEVWSIPAQIMLIDTILRNIPIPKIYIKSLIKNGQTYRIVVDGQQRLSAILKFVNNLLKLKSPYQGEYSGCKFSDLPQDAQDSILRYKIDINEIFNPTDDEIRDLYARVNKYTVQLNKQELRKADFPGDYINLAEKISENEFFAISKIFTVKQRRRMLDVEYVEELLAILVKGVQDKKESLDDICQEFVDMGDNADIIEENFEGVLADLSIIFDNKNLSIESTRFKQKSDFYSLFAAVHEIRNENKVIESSNLHLTQKNLLMISDKVDPHSDEEIYREYAMKCIGDANSINSRNWRKKYLKDYLLMTYKDGDK